jgi:hypothetical protein
MSKIAGVVPLSFLLLWLAGCSSAPVDEDRAGCSFVEGKGRYGTLTQYVKGEGKGVYVYTGGNMKDTAAITCNAKTQEIKVEFKSSP